LSFRDEGSEIRQLKELLGRDDPLIIETGANCGQTTHEFLNVFPRAEVYAFEADPRTLRKFKSFIDSGPVNLVEKAIGVINGTVEFN
jgi:FkbM family methyltransferase